MPNDDVELNVKISGSDQAKRELQDIARAAEDVKASGSGSAVNAIEQAKANTELEDTLNKVGTISTILGVDRRNVTAVTRGYRLLSEAISGTADSAKALGAAASQAVKFLAHPLVLGLAAVILAIKTAYDQLAESQQKSANAQRNANDQTREAIRLIDELNAAQKESVDILAETETALRAGGEQPTRKRVEEVALAVEEAAARTGQKKELFLGLALGQPNVSANSLIASIGGGELPADSALRERNIGRLKEFRSRLDTSEEAEAARQAKVRALNAAEESLRRELQESQPNETIFTGGGVVSIPSRAPNPRRDELRGQIQQIVDQRNSIIFNAPDARRTRPSTSQISVP